MRVWLEEWEWQCCGDPFAVGSEVEWGLVALEPKARSGFAGPLGELTHRETHHEYDDEVEVVVTRGRVESIDAA